MRAEEVGKLRLRGSGLQKLNAVATLLKLGLKLTILPVEAYLCAEAEERTEEKRLC
jgi:hypothetical protein